MKKLISLLAAMVLLLSVLPAASLADTVEYTICPDQQASCSVTHFVTSTSVDTSKYSFSVSTKSIAKDIGLYRGTLISQAVYQSGSRVGTNFFYTIKFTGKSEGQTTINLLYNGSVIKSVNVTVGHDWDKATYEWSDDYSQVTATRHCGRNAEHNATETVKTTCKVTQAATAAKAGRKVYTATFTNAAFTTQTKEVTIPKGSSDAAGSGSNADPADSQAALKKIGIKKLTAVSAKKIKVEWKKLSSADRKKISQIQIQVSTDKSFSKIIKKKTVSSGKTSCTISGLKKNTKYYVRIRAYTKSGNTESTSAWAVKSRKTKKK